MNLKENHNESKPEILTIQEAANLLRVCERKIYYLMEQGILKHYCIPNTKKRLFKKEEVLGLLQEAA